MFSPELLSEVRSRFAHVETCPFTGPRVFFENAGGALTLNSVVETTAKFAAIPDNQGRDNAASHALVSVIDQARDDVRTFFGAAGGTVLFGESGTELLFRLIREACLSPGAGAVIGSTAEHPASRSACTRWAAQSGRAYLQAQHDPELGLVLPAAYEDILTEDAKVVTIVHTSPVTGMAMDIASIARAVRRIAPEAFIIVDGIQHACHGGIDIEALGVDGYVISPYKVFSRHGYGVAWASERLTAVSGDGLVGAPAKTWEFGTRDTGAYATMSDVVAYFSWLGAQVSSAETQREKIKAASKAIHDHESALTTAMVYGTGNLPGLADMKNVHIVGGADNPAREGLVSFWVDGQPSAEIVEALANDGIRVHVRKADHYSGNILEPLGQADCIRVSLCHYNSLHEVGLFLSAMLRILE